jgi:hypothetical protein
MFKEKRRVNGVDVWFLRMDAELNKIPVVLCGYYYSGKSGTVQVVTFTGKSLFSQFEKDFMEFLNGLWISEQDAQVVRDLWDGGTPEMKPVLSTRTSAS